MGNESGTWIMHGLPDSSPDCIRTHSELLDFINTVGFLPLFKNSVPGFSVEEHTSPRYWWSDIPEKDPWIWREILSGGQKVAYGKFFDKKAGFISLAWLPYFANWRRDGYDFDVLWDDQKASYREKKIMDLFGNGESLLSCEIKRKAGFGKDGEKNFEGTVTGLEMRMYLVRCGFRCRLNKSGLPYGWPLADYRTPESIWGYDLVTSRYDDDPEDSGMQIMKRMREMYPLASEEQIRQILK